MLQISLCYFPNISFLFHPLLLNEILAQAWRSKITHIYLVHPFVRSLVNWFCVRLLPCGNTLVDIRSPTRWNATWLPLDELSEGPRNIYSCFIMHLLTEPGQWCKGQAAYIKVNVKVEFIVWDVRHPWYSKAWFILKNHLIRSGCLRPSIALTVHNRGLK